jgi:Na+-translocating ferredoxin:NAD+ oxidoreductase RnfG subunit
MEAVVVAVIAAVGGVLVALVQGMRKENRDDHAMVGQALNRIEIKLDNHIDDHLKGDI